MPGWFVPNSGHSELVGGNRKGPGRVSGGPCPGAQLCDFYPRSVPVAQGLLCSNRIGVPAARRYWPRLFVVSLGDSAAHGPLRIVGVEPFKEGYCGPG